MTHDETTSPQQLTRGWPRAAALLGVVLFISVIRPSVLIAIPLVVLFGIRGIRGRAVFIVLLAMLFAMSGDRDGIWFAERALQSTPCMRTPHHILRRTDSTYLSESREYCRRSARTLCMTSVWLDPPKSCCAHHVAVATRLI